MSVASNTSSKALLKCNEPASLSYVQLKKYTDLNVPPSNWLCDNYAGRFTNQNVRKTQPLDYSSLLMADKFPDVLGEVDVISAAEQIKKLLKMSFSKSQVSMSVHRIGKSLLLNDFDIPKLVHSQEESKQWDWLGSLYKSASADTDVYPKKRNKEQSALEIMFSKFMYHSIEGGEKKVSETSSSQMDTLMGDYSSNFQRDILWNFEDITMLVGSDLPIFGNGKYPAVSLRLRESSKPINVLTGIDYWLDNLMCNVPELIMCYHLKGIVQQYEQIKTTDLPNVEGSSFSPTVICDVAQNILSFLKSNCAKEGHTYWLFKSRNDDIVKLYDLTSIGSTQGHEDPFKVSVAMLLYKIARNMFLAAEISEKNIKKLISMLESSLLLLEGEEGSDRFIAVNFLLSQLYSSQFHDSTEKPKNDFDSSNSNSDDEQSGTEKLSVVSEMSLKAIHIPKASIQSSENCCTKSLSMEYRSKRAISCISHAIRVYAEGDNLKTVTSPHKNALEILSAKQSFENEIQVLLKSFHNSHYKQTIQQRFFVAVADNYLRLGNIYVGKQKLGHALKYVQFSFLCLSEMEHLSFTTNEITNSLMLYADILAMLPKICLNKEAELEDFLAWSETDSRIARVTIGQCVVCGVDTAKMKDCFSESKETLLMQSLNLYESVYSKITMGEENFLEIVNVTRRLGNVRNELGVVYMGRAANQAKLFGLPSDIEVQLWKKSFDYFQKSVEDFTLVNDRLNLALLYSNCGKLMYLCAKVFGNSSKMSVESERDEFTQQEKTYFGKVFEYYSKALSVLENEEHCPEIWCSVSIELSSAYYTMACLMQDYAPSAHDNIVKEISSTFMKALQHSEPLQENSGEVRQTIGHIHQRLGSLYHHVLRKQVSDSGKKNFRSLAELHYKKIYSVLPWDDYPLQILRGVVEHLALYDFISPLQPYKYVRLKINLCFNGMMLTCLQSLSKSQPMEEDLGKILNIVYEQISAMFKEIIRLNKKQKSLNGIRQSMEIEAFKECFRIVLCNQLPEELSEKLTTLAAIVSQVQNIAPNS